jgi:hypothetical protein
MIHFNLKTVKLSLLEGYPSGSKKVQLSNWSGFAFTIPRSSLNITIKRDELSKQCVYFLLGGTSTSQHVYIGEAENFQKRILQHQNKDFWNMCVVFLSKDDNLSKAHIKYLEASLIKDCKIANRSNLENANQPEGSKLSEEDEAEMIEFKDNIKLILSVLGFTFHNIENPNEQKNKIFSIKAKGIQANAIYTSEGVVLLEGSQIAKNETPSASNGIRNLRKEKLDEGYIIDREEFFEVIKKITFTGVSTASSFVLGRNSNGWIEWKNKLGKSLDEVERGNGL